MQRFDAVARRLVPAVPALSRKRLLMGPLDLLDRVISMPFGVGRALPPNRMRIRVGVGNRILFNQLLHASMPANFWINALATGLARLDSRILDIGSGCGRFAAMLRDFEFYGRVFSGHYTGIDIDPEMVDWCRRHFPPDRFTFRLSQAYSSVYNPGGPAQSAGRLDVEDSSQDFAFSVSLLTHLLEADVRRCLQETRRVLAPGAAMLMTVFCMDHLADRLGGRWTFRHRRGDAWIESTRYPEAAVAYSLDWITAACRETGLEPVEVLPGGDQSLLRARRPA